MAKKLSADEVFELAKSFHKLSNQVGDYRFDNWDTLESEERADGTRRTTRYDIDLFKCIYCGFCEESCPVDSIVETRFYEFHFENRGEHIITKPELLAIGDQFEKQIAADRAADARYR